MIKYPHNNPDKVPIIPDHKYYIVWDDMSTPIVECNGDDIIQYWDDADAVAFDMVLIDKNEKDIFYIRGYE